MFKSVRINKTPSAISEGFLQIVSFFLPDAGNKTARIV